MSKNLPPTLVNNNRKPTVSIGSDTASEFRVDVPLVVGGENLVNTLKELRDRIESLEAEVAALRNR